MKKYIKKLTAFLIISTGFATATLEEFLANPETYLAAVNGPEDIVFADGDIEPIATMVGQSGGFVERSCMHWPAAPKGSPLFGVRIVPEKIVPGDATIHVIVPKREDPASFGATVSQLVNGEANGQVPFELIRGTLEVLNGSERLVVSCAKAVNDDDARILIGELGFPLTRKTISENTRPELAQLIERFGDTVGRLLCDHSGASRQGDIVLDLSHDSIQLLGGQVSATLNFALSPEGMNIWLDLYMSPRQNPADLPQ